MVVKVMTEFKSFTVTCNSLSGGNHDISYSSWGDEDSQHCVLAVHGLTRNGQDFDQLAKRLAQKGMRVICPDMAGRHRSQKLKNPKDYGMPQYILDINQVLEHAKLKTETIDWVGTSMGGLIAMSYLIMGDMAAWKVRRLVLNDVGPFLEGKALKRIAIYVAQDTNFPDYQSAYNHTKEVYANFGIRNQQDWDDFIAISLMQNSDGSYSRSFDANIAVNFANLSEEDVNLWEIWQKIERPTLLLRGAESDLLSAETAKKMIETSSQVQLVTLANCGHAPPLLYDDQIQPIIDFLTKP